MDIRIVRRYKKADYTVGDLYLNNRWVCNTLEPRCIDWSRQQKVPGETAIPPGTYPVEMLHSKRFNRLMPFLMDVPQFEGVMIHTGNSPKQTKGCILVGYNTVRGLVLKSREAFDKLLVALDNARRSGHIVACTVQE